MKMKFCPNCGEQLTEETRFCTKCGFDTQASTAATEPSSATNDQPVTQRAAKAANQHAAKIQQISSGYFQWLRDSIKRPNEVTQGEVYFGWLSLGINTLLVTIAIVIAINNSIKATAGLASSVLQISNVPSLPFSYDLKVFIAVLIGNLIYVLVGFTSVKVLDPTSDVKFLSFTNRFAHLTNSGLIVDVVMILAALMVGGSSFSTVGFPLVLIVIGSTVWWLGYVLSIRQVIKAYRFDRYYVLLAACLALAVILLIFGYVEMTILKADLMSEATRSVGSFSNWFK